VGMQPVSDPPDAVVRQRVKADRELQLVDAVETEMLELTRAVRSLTQWSSKSRAAQRNDDLDSAGHMSEQSSPDDGDDDDDDDDDDDPATRRLKQLVRQVRRQQRWIASQGMQHVPARDQSCANQSVQTETLLDNAVSDHLRNSVQRFQHAVDQALNDWSSYDDQVHAY